MLQALDSTRFNKATRLMPKYSTKLS